MAKALAAYAMYVHEKCGRGTFVQMEGRLDAGVATVNDQLGAGNVLAGVGREKHNGTLEVRGVGHATLQRQHFGQDQR